MTLDYLKRLTVNQIQQERLPLKAILKDSLYYPACDIDGELIRYCNMHFDSLKICSFVYADYAAGRERLMANLDTFRGYHLVATRQLNPSDVGADKSLPMPEGITPEEYCRYQKDWQPFGQWSVFERDEDCGEYHGPLRFSLLYLGAEGAAAYAGLYLNNNITPKGMAIIQPGHGFGLNWTNFTDSNGPLLRTMKMGKSMPQFFFYGGMGYEGYDKLPWPGYERIDRVDHYYPHYPESAMTVWQGNVVFLKVYDGKRESNYGVTLQIMDNPRTMPHDYVDHVFVEHHGRSYEATIGTYRHDDTLRGAETIKELIIQNDWQPGDSLYCVFYNNNYSHTYKIINQTN